MSLNKQQVTVNFARGVDTKTDPWQVPIGSFLELENSVFTKQGLLQKRNGYQQLGQLSDKNITGISTLNDQLTLFGKNVFTYQDGGLFYDRGFYRSAKVEATSLVKGTFDVIQCDSVTINNLVCVVYTEEPIAGVLYYYKYAIFNAETGQMIVAPTSLTGVGGNPNGSPRVYAHNNNFVIIYSASVSGTDRLQYTRVSSVTLTAEAPVQISSDFLYNTQGDFDAVSGQGNLYIVWQSSNANSRVNAIALDPSFNLGLPVVVSSGTIRSKIVTCAFDTTTNNLSVVYYDDGTTGGTGPSLYLSIRSLTLTSVLAQTTVVAVLNPLVSNVAVVSVSGTNTILFERINSYTYSPTVPTNYISKVNVTTAGVVGSVSDLIRGNGLASKIFSIDSELYVTTAHQSPEQDSYFVINLDGKVVSKHAYQLGDGYVRRGLPNVTVSNHLANFCYLNKISTTIGQSGVTEAAGINYLDLTIGNVPVSIGELGGNLNASGGFLWSYDGVMVSENNFFLYPENINVSGTVPWNTSGGLIVEKYFYTVLYKTFDSQGNIIQGAPSTTLTYEVLASGSTFTANATLGNNTLTNVSSFTGVQVGQRLSGTGFSLATISAIDTSANTITLNTTASANSTGATYTINSAVKSVSIKAPTLRTSNRDQSVTTGKPIFIEVYRSSTSQPVDYFIGGTVNDPTIDFVTISDASSNATITANPVLYTYGGVLPNFSGPPCTSISLYDNRLWVSDSEKPGYLWYSKAVIPGTPVEMTAFQTYYVTPTLGAQGYTGKITALCPMDDKLILFKEDAIYYINGVGPDATGANNGLSEPIFINGTVGAKNSSCVAIMPLGLMFQSDKGIWLLGRDTSTNYVGAPVEALTESATTIQALTIPNTNQVRFMLNSGKTVMFDYFFQQWGVFTNQAATCSNLFKQLHTFVDADGRLFQEAIGTYVDGTKPVLMKFKTGWFALGGMLGFQRAYFLFLLGKYYSPHKLTVDLAYDFNPASTQTTIITPNNYNLPFGDDTIYGSPSFFGGTEYIEKWRIMLQRQKCDSVQITISESYDPTVGEAAGQGLTLSGMNFIIGVKRLFNTVPAAITAG